MKKKFPTDPARADPGRAQLKLKPDAKLALDGVVSNISPDLVPDADVKGLLKEQMARARFAIAQNRTTCSAEIGHVSSLRIGFEGNREVCCLPTAKLYAFLRQSNRQKVPSLKDLYAWVKVATRRRSRHSRLLTQVLTVVS